MQCHVCVFEEYNMTCTNMSIPSSRSFYVPVSTIKRSQKNLIWQNRFYLEVYHGGNFKMYLPKAIYEREDVEKKVNGGWVTQT